MEFIAVAEYSHWNRGEQSGAVARSEKKKEKKTSIGKEFSVASVPTPCQEEQWGVYLGPFHPQAARNGRNNWNHNTAITAADQRVGLGGGERDRERLGVYGR